MFDLIITVAIILMLIGMIYSIYQLPIIFYGVIKLKNKEDIDDPEFNDLVSVIVPAKNEEKVIGRCLDSILNQTYKNIEVIVVEDGSSDRTLEICKEYEKKDKRIKCYHRDISNGKPSALNYALKISRGNIIATFDADSILEKDTIYRALIEMHSRNLDALQGENYSVNSKENIITRIGFIDQGLIKLALLGRNAFDLFLPLGGSNQYFRREVLEELNGWDERYLTEDLEISLRMNIKNKKIAYSTSVRCGQETPSKMGEFVKQRTRWYRGYHQVLFHSKKEIRNKKHLDSLLVISAPLISSLWFISLILLAIGVIMHSITSTQLIFLIYFGLFLFVLNLISIILISIKNYRILAYLPIAYIYWFISSVISFYSLMLELLKRERRWLKVEKTGRVTN
ncbi:MAG: glycosyltransferase [Thermoplasmata archaeon]